MKSAVHKNIRVFVDDEEIGWRIPKPAEGFVVDVIEALASESSE